MIYKYKFILCIRYTYVLKFGKARWRVARLVRSCWSSENWHKSRACSFIYYFKRSLRWAIHLYATPFIWSFSVMFSIKKLKKLPRKSKIYLFIVPTTINQRVYPTQLLLPKRKSKLNRLHNNEKSKVDVHSILHLPLVVIETQIVIASIKLSVNCW